jgi:hypothetical protein
MDWLINAFNRILAFLYSLVLTIIDAISDIFAYLFDSMLKAVDLIISAVMTSLSAIPIPDTVPLPSGVAWVASQLGVPQMIVMITACLVIRVGLQLIPFVRLGS